MKTLLAFLLCSIPLGAQCKVPDFSTFDALVQQQKLFATVTFNGTVSGSLTLRSVKYTLSNANNLIVDLAAQGIAATVQSSVVTIPDGKSLAPSDASTAVGVTLADQPSSFAIATAARDAAIQSAVADCQSKIAVLNTATANTDALSVGVAAKGVNFSYPSAVRAALLIFIPQVTTMLNATQMSGLLIAIMPNGK